MKPDIHSHLTDEALDDVIIGVSSLASQAHLAHCPECRARVAEFQSSVELFNQAALAYSEAQRAKALPEARSARRLLARPIFAVWAAAAALLILAGPAAWHVFAPHPVHAPVAAFNVDSEAQIAEDNELLRQIDAAIAPDEQSIVEQYQLQEEPDPQAHPRKKTE